MKFGMNLLLWTAHLDDSILPVLDRLKAMGYDGVEIPMFELDEASTASGGSDSMTPGWSGQRLP